MWRYQKSVGVHSAGLRALDHQKENIFRSGACNGDGEQLRNGDVMHSSDFGRKLCVHVGSHDLLRATTPCDLQSLLMDR